MNKKLIFAWCFPTFVILFIILLDIFLIKENRFNSIFIRIPLSVQLLLLFLISSYSFFLAYNKDLILNYKSLIVLKILLSVFIEFLIFELILSFYFLFFGIVII